LEVKNVDLPQEMQRAIARQAEAKRNVAQRSFTLKANSKPPNPSPMRPT
jgi:regulator of protease activity HflC (stomatin/prohibitin superfamily)